MNIDEWGIKLGVEMLNNFAEDSMGGRHGNDEIVLQ